MSRKIDPTSLEVQLMPEQIDCQNHLVMKDGKWEFQIESPELVYEQPVAEYQDMLNHSESKLSDGVGLTNLGHERVFEKS